MSDYSNGKIYKIVCNITGDVYIGSTCEPILARRLVGHVHGYKRYLTGKGNNMTSFKIIANGDYSIVLIELFPCDTKDQLHARERHYTQTIQCVNRIKNQGLFIKLGKKEYDKQYNEQHKEHILEHIKKYNLANNERIKKYNNTVLICQCGCSYTRKHKVRHERSKKHREYEQNKLYIDIRRGLDMIKFLDDYFLKKQ
jgi:hypothetical protein